VLYTGFLLKFSLKQEVTQSGFEKFLQVPVSSNVLTKPVVCLMGNQTPRDQERLRTLKKFTRKTTLNVYLTMFI